jgi:hypothetical protein
MRIRVLSLTPGRLRIHLSDWSGDGRERIESRLLRMPGVQVAQVNPLTGNVLIHFSPVATGVPSILAALQQLPGPEADGAGADQGRGPSASLWLRVGIRGLLGHAVVDSLWFGAGFLGQSVGLPLAGLGPLHVLLDIAVWGAALASAGQPERGHPGRTDCGRDARTPALGHHF